MRQFRSIRWRLLAWYGPLLTMIVGGLCVAAYHFVSSQQLRRIDEELQRSAGRVAGAVRPKAGPPANGNPNLPTHAPAHRSNSDEPLYGGAHDIYYVVWLKNGAPITPSPNAPPDVPRPLEGTSGVRTRGNLRELYNSGQPGDCVLVGTSITDERAGLQELAWKLGLGGAALLVVGLAGGWLIVSKALEPIASITSAARRITEGDLSHRISLTETESELGGMAAVLNSMFCRLDEAFARQKRFTADAAHELRTPVTVMLTHAQNGLSSENLTEEQREAFEACQRSAQRMRRLIEALLQLARCDAGQAAPSRETCDLATIGREAAAQLESIFRAGLAILHLDLQPAPTLANPEQLVQVVSNLLTNAVYHGRAQEGEVWLRTAAEGKFATLSVWDNGPGIDSAHLPHLFERFYRLDKARTGGAGRTGLGLAISQAIVQMHAGTITVESTPGRGTTFTVRLPLV